MGTIVNPKPFKYKKFDKTLSRVLLFPKSKWYQQLKSSVHFNELTLQNILIIKFKALLPSYGIIYYEKNITSLAPPYEDKKPDFLLWKKDYSEWYVIEVELANHKKKHISDQLDAFYNGDYSDYVAITDYVGRKYPNLDKAKFGAMITSIRPKIMLIADKIDCIWRAEFSKYKCLFATLQVYSDENDHLLYRISGDFPQEYTKYTYANIDKFGPSLLVDSKSFIDELGYEDGDRIKIFYQGESDEWQYLIDSNGNASLYYQGELMNIDLKQKIWKLVINTKKQIHLIK